MKIGFAVGVVAMLALTGCGGQPKAATESSTSATSSSSKSSESSATSATSAARPAVPAKGGKPTRDFVIGKWGTNGDCALAIDLRADGTSDGPFGNWSYSDGVISFPEEPDFKVSVTVLDDNTMESTNASSDKTSKMTRCP